eukprot:403341050
MLKLPQQSQLLKPPISHAPTPKSSLTPKNIKLEEQSTFQKAELRLKYQNQFKKQTQNMDLMRAIKEMKDHLEQEESQTKSSPKAYHTIVQETVDQIYQESSEEFKENIQLLDKHLKKWVKDGEEPPNLEVTVMNKKEQIQKQKDREEALNPKREDMHQIIEEQTKQICEKYGIKVKQLKETIGYQIDRFCNNENAFMYFKKKATVDRTLRAQNEYQELSKRNKEYQERIKEEYFTKKPTLENQRKVSQLELWQVQRKQNLNQQSQSVLDLQLDLTIKDRDLKQVDNFRNRNNHTTLQHQSTSLNTKNFITVEPLNGVGNQQKTLITNDSKLQLINMSFKEDKKQHQNPLVLPNFSNSYQISPDQSQNQLKHLGKNSHQTIDVNQLNKSVMRQEKQNNKNNYHLKSLSVDNSLTQFNFHQVSQNISTSVNSPQNSNLNARQTQFLFNSHINMAKNTNDLDKGSTKEDSKITNFPQIVNKQTNINFKFNDNSRQPSLNQAKQNNKPYQSNRISSLEVSQENLRNISPQNSKLRKLLEDQSSRPNKSKISISALNNYQQIQLVQNSDRKQLNFKHNQESQAQLQIKKILSNCKEYEETDKDLGSPILNQHTNVVNNSNKLQINQESSILLPDQQTQMQKIKKKLHNNSFSIHEQQESKNFISPQKYHFIDEQLLLEKLKSENLMKLSKDLRKLTDFKPQLLKAFYKETKNSYMMQCETEKQCAEQYMIKKMDTRIQKMLEYKTKKRQSM